MCIRDSSRHDRARRTSTTAPSTLLASLMPSSRLLPLLVCSCWLAGVSVGQYLRRSAERLRHASWHADTEATETPRRWLKRIARLHARPAARAALFSCSLLVVSLLLA